MKTTTLCAAALVVFLPHSAVGQEWRGLVVAPEERCAPYDDSEYHYSQSVESRIADSLGGVYSPCTCETFRALNETDIEHVVARSEAHDPACVRPRRSANGSLPALANNRCSPEQQTSAIRNIRAWPSMGVGETHTPHFVVEGGLAFFCPQARPCTTSGRKESSSARFRP